MTFFLLGFAAGIVAWILLGVLIASTSFEARRPDWKYGARDRTEEQLRREGWDL